MITRIWIAVTGVAVVMPIVRVTAIIIVAAIAVRIIAEVKIRPAVVVVRVTRIISGIVI